MPISRRFITKDGTEITVSAEDSEREACDVYSRVVGYYRPKSDYNIGKKSEFADRKFYTEPAPHLLEPQPRLPGTD